MRLAGIFPFENATSYAYFREGGLLQELIHLLKYSGKEKIGHWFGERLGLAIQAVGWQPNVVMPVPLHKRRQAKRGFNQSESISIGIGQALNIPVVTNALLRVKNTHTQTDKTREERLKNVEGAFSLQNPENLEGKHVLLIDDVLTTGATIESVAKEVHKVHSIRISVATIGLVT